MSIVYIVKILFPPVETFLQYSINHILQLPEHNAPAVTVPRRARVGTHMSTFQMSGTARSVCPRRRPAARRPCRVAFQGEFITAGAQTSAMQVSAFDLVNGQS